MTFLARLRRRRALLREAAELEEAAAGHRRVGSEELRRLWLGLTTRDIAVSVCIDMAAASEALRRAARSKREEAGRL